MRESWEEKKTVVKRMGADGAFLMGVYGRVWECLNSQPQRKGMCGGSGGRKALEALGRLFTTEKRKRILIPEV